MLTLSLDHKTQAIYGQTTLSVEEYINFNKGQAGRGNKNVGMVVMNEREKSQGTLRLQCYLETWDKWTRQSTPRKG